MQNYKSSSVSCALPTSCVGPCMWTDAACRHLCRARHGVEPGPFRVAAAVTDPCAVGLSSDHMPSWRTRRFWLLIHRLHKQRGEQANPNASSGRKPDHVMEDKADRGGAFLHSRHSIFQKLEINLVHSDCTSQNYFPTSDRLYSVSLRSLHSSGRNKAYTLNIY